MKKEFEVTLRVVTNNATDEEIQMLTEAIEKTLEKNSRYLPESVVIIQVMNIEEV